MVRLLSFLILSTLLRSHALAVRFEEQRKYNFTTKKMFPLEPFSIADFAFYPHSLYINGDIYFDTEDRLLQKAQLSLRLRRVKKGSADYLYAVQLKSEMESAVNSMRIEEEYKELGNQRVDNIPIKKIIDTILDKPTAPESQKALELAARWMARKGTSSLSPFQMLRQRGLSAKELKPTLIGRAHRSRYHVYFDKTARVSALLELDNSEKNLALTPDFFKKHIGRVWLMEASVDNSTFFSIKKPELLPFKIQELELENKYRPREKGSNLLSQLEKTMIPQFRMRQGAASKFSQAAQHFQFAQDPKSKPLLKQ